MLTRTIAGCAACLLWAAQARALDPLALGSSVALARAPESTAEPNIERQLAQIATELGYQVMPPERVASTLGAAFECDQSDLCDLNSMRSLLGVDAIVLFSVTMDEGGATMLQLRALGTGGSEQAETALPKDSQGTLLSLLTQVLNHEAPAVRPTTVLIATVPPRARVGIDDLPKQEAPARFEVPPGRHRIKGKLEGYIPVMEDVVIPAQDVPFAYKLNLPQSTSTSEGKSPRLGSDAGPRPYAGPSPWNYILAGGLGLGAAGLATYAVFEARRDGNCVARSELERCTFVRDSDVAVIGAAVGASVGALSALGFIIFSPLKVEVAPDHARLQVSHQF